MTTRSGLEKVTDLTTCICSMQSICPSEYTNLYSRSGKDRSSFYKVRRKTTKELANKNKAIVLSTWYASNGFYQRGEISTAQRNDFETDCTDR